jgi:hypothetical protein
VSRPGLQSFRRRPFTAAADKDDEGEDSTTPAVADKHDVMACYSAFSAEVLGTIMSFIGDPALSRRYCLPPMRQTFLVLIPRTAETVRCAALTHEEWRTCATDCFFCATDFAEQELICQECRPTGGLFEASSGELCGLCGGGDVAQRPLLNETVMVVEPVLHNRLSRLPYKQSVTDWINTNRQWETRRCCYRCRRHLILDWYLDWPGHGLGLAWTRRPHSIIAESS